MSVTIDYISGERQKRGGMVSKFKVYGLEQWAEKIERSSRGHKRRTPELGYTCWDVPFGTLFLMDLRISKGLDEKARLLRVCMRRKNAFTMVEDWEGPLWASGEFTVMHIIGETEEANAFLKESLPLIEKGEFDADRLNEIMKRLAER